MDKNKKLFPQRLWELIHDGKYNFCLRWSPDGQRVYLNRNEFEAHYLRTPHNQFHTQKAISFVRQMNMYGFKKVDDCYYENDNFKRNCHHLLKNMVRRNSNKSCTSSAGSTSAGSHTTHLLDEDVVFAESRELRRPATESQRQQQQHHSHHQIQLLPASRAPLDQYALDPLAETSGQLQANANNAAILNAVGAIMAALGTSSANTTPLASTLYHRLATLNFGAAPPTGPEGSNQQLSSQLDLLDLGADTAAQLLSLGGQPLSNGTLSHTSGSGSPVSGLSPQPPVPNTSFNVADIPMGLQQPIVARQAIQQILVQSLLQLKQNQLSLNVDPNLSLHIQQQAAMHQLRHLHQQQQQQQVPTANIASPIQSGSAPGDAALSSAQNLQRIFHRDLIGSAQTNAGLLWAKTSSNGGSNSTNNGSAGCEIQQLHDVGEMGLHRDVSTVTICSDSDDDADQMIHYEGRLYKRDSGSLPGNSSTSSSYYADVGEDNNEAALNLAKPSAARSGQSGQRL